MIRQKQRKVAARKGQSKLVAKNHPHLERLEQREVLDAALKFDFGSAVSPVAPDFTRVTESTRFSATQGYGWVSGIVESRDRGVADALNRDFNFSPDGTFAVNLANGTYSVTVTLGDSLTLHDQTLFLEGQQVDSITAKGGEFVTRTYTVGVTDGQLGLRLYGLGGKDDNAVINSMVITPVSSTPTPVPPTPVPPTPVPPAAAVTYDFGTPTSPVAAGAQGVSSTNPSTDARAAGWRSGKVESRDRGGADATTRDFHFMADATFGVPVANGTYTVTVTLGDSEAPHDLMGVFLEGARVDSVTTAKGQFAVNKYTVQVADGELTLRLADLGGKDAFAVINGLSVTPSGNPLPPVTGTFGNGGAVNEGSAGSVSFGGVGGGASGYKYSYDFDNNGTFEVSNSASATAVVPSSFLADGASSRVVRGVVTDSAGASASYTTTIQINNVAPTVAITTASANIAGNVFSFGATATDPSADDQARLTYAWDFGDGTTGVGSSASHTYTRGGAYTVRVTVTDKDGGSSFATTPITVAGTGTSVTGTFGNGGAVNEGSAGAVSFTGVSGGAGGYTYSYDFNNDGTFEVSNSASATAVVPSSFLADGPTARVIRGVVRDSAGASASYTTSLQVNNVAPVVAIPVASASGSTFAFTGSATDASAADQAGLTYTWDFGDGTSGTGQNPSHTYAAAGTYTVRLTAADKDGGSGSATTPVTIAPSTPPPGPTPAGLRLQFGTDTTAVVAGFTKVTPTQLYSASTGYGWASAVDSRNRGTSDPLGGSFNFGLSITFLTDLAPGRYDVRVTAGDVLASHDTTLSFNGTQVGSFLSQVGLFHQQVYTADVGADGRLTIRLDGFGGIDDNAVLNALEIFPTGQLPAAVVPVPNPPAPGGGGGGGGGGGTVTTPRPSDGYIVTPAGYIPNFGANPTIVSARSGAWSDPATWAQGRVPGANDVVSIAGGMTVSYDAYGTSPVTTVVVQANGHLVFRTDINTRLTVNNLLVLEQGELQIGTASQPVAAGVKAEVIFADTPLNTTFDPEQFGNGLIGLGKVTMHGQSRGETFLQLAAEPRAGSTTLRLQVPANGWAVGDRVLVPDTRQLAEDTGGPDSPNYVPQYELMTIGAISADRMTLTLTTALRFDHFGARTDTGVLDLLPHVANMTRNVSIRSAANLGTRGHTLFTGKADVDIRNTSFGGLGRTKVSRLDATTFDENWNVTHVGTNVTGRYPVQFKHLVGPTGGQANGFQFTFEGNAVVCQMDPQPFRWGVAIDDSHYGSVQNNLVYNWAGAGIAVVSGNETGNVIGRNYISRVRGETLGMVRSDDRGFRDVGFEGVGLWMRSLGNHIRGNVVNDGQLSYLYWPVTGGETVRIPAFQGADTNVAGQTTLIGLASTAIREFVGNQTYGGFTAQGLSIWNVGAGSVATPNSSQEESVIKDFTAWHVADRVFYNYVTSHLTFDGLIARGDFSKLQRTGSGPFGLYAGDYTQQNFLVKNSNIQGFMTGVTASTLGNQQTIQNTYLSNYWNIRVDNRYSTHHLGADTPGINILVDNVRFGAPVAPKDGFAAPANIYLNGGSNNPVTSIIAAQTIDVRNYNGVAGDNFRVYFREQAANHILTMTSYNPDGYLVLIGAPVAGLTNQQAWDQYHIAWAGAVAPTTATTRAGIIGLVA